MVRLSFVKESSRSWPVTLFQACFNLDLSSHPVIPFNAFELWRMFACKMFLDNCVLAKVSEL